jgi:hypothetical protein
MLTPERNLPHSEQAVGRLCLMLARVLILCQVRATD